MIRVFLDDVDITSGINAAGEMMRLHGVEVVIENPKGSVRRGVKPDGSTWEAVLPADYGFIRGKGEGGDGDPLDCFVGPTPGSERVFVVKQIDPRTKKFDEWKVLLGYLTIYQAAGDYIASYSDDPWPRVGAIREMSMEEFKRWDPSMTTDASAESERLISEWKAKIKRFPSSRERLASVLASLALGREFGESAEQYFERRGFGGFVSWVKSGAKVE